MDFSRFIQIAGVKNAPEARMLIEEGVRYLGFPLRLPVHKPDLGEPEAKALIAAFPPGVAGVLITYLEKAGQIVDLADFLGVSCVQLHGDIAPKETQKLKQTFPWLTLLKSLVVGSRPPEQLSRLAEAFVPWVDAFITDTYDPASGASGATGKIHDWEFSRFLSKNLAKPLILAGGLNPGNVREAILKVKPAGVDAHTGVEDSRGRKDREKIRRFLAEARAGFEALNPQ